jgi:hypothetical protein
MFYVIQILWFLKMYKGLHPDFSTTSTSTAASTSSSTSSSVAVTSVIFGFVGLGGVAA